MRALRLWTDIVEWRWTPALGLSIGAVTFVGFAVLMIPDRIGDSATPRLSAIEALRTRSSAFAASIAPNVAEPEPAAQTAGADAPIGNADMPRASGPTALLNHFPRRGFTPPLPRPELPVAAPPSPAVVMTVPQPPPQAPAPERFPATPPPPPAAEAPQPQPPPPVPDTAPAPPPPPPPPE